MGVCVAELTNTSRVYQAQEGDSPMMRRMLKSKRLDIERELWCECECLTGLPERTVKLS